MSFLTRTKGTSLNNRWSAGCMVLFALPFAAVGVGMASWNAYALMQHAAMMSWIEVPATIESVDQEHGDGTAETVAKYKYEFGGRTYAGSRVSVYSGRDNVGSFQDDVYSELRRHRDTGKPFRCFVNPREPSEAILYRNLRGEMLAFFTIFATVFGSVGFGLAAGALLSSKHTPQWVADGVPPDQLWRSRSDWAAGEIRDKGMSTPAVLAIVAVYWNVAALPLYLSLPAILPQSRWMWYALLFPAMGVSLISAMVYVVTRKRKYGESVLQLASTPGVIGGHLGGVVRIPKPVSPLEGFRVLLSCTKKSSNGENTTLENLHQDERLVVEPMRDEVTGTTAIPLLFAIPYDCLESTPPGSQEVEWLITVIARTSGIDYKAEFEVPVFRTPESRQNFELDPKLAGDFAISPSSEYLFAQAGLFKEPLAGGGVRFVFPAGRNPGPAIGLSLFLLLWFGAVAYIAQRDAADVFTYVFFGAGALIAWLALDSLLYRSVVEADAHELSRRGGWLGLGRRRVLARNEIASFSTTKHISSGKDAWLNVVVITKKGRKVKLAKGISGLLAAKAVVNDLSAAVGVAAEASAK